MRHRWDPEKERANAKVGSFCLGLAMVVWLIIKAFSNHP